MSADYSKLTKAQLVDALDIMQERARQRARDERERPTFEQSLARIVDELHALNSRQDQFYREVLDVLTAAKDGDGSLRSGQPEAAPGCRVCGKLGVIDACGAAEDLNRRQWKLHFDAMFYERRAFGAAKAAEHAEQQMHLWFGPCPEES